MELPPILSLVTSNILISYTCSFDSLTPSSLILLSLVTNNILIPSIYSLSYDPGWSWTLNKLPSLVIAVIPISLLTEKLKIFISESVRALFLNYPKILSLSI
uniref:Uncharacterized protein n=1 Tax=Cacopsylla melanoneura TaxID=428564 RepID=A0A8D8Z3H2_9HEMI